MQATVVEADRDEGRHLKQRLTRQQHPIAAREASDSRAAWLTLLAFSYNAAANAMLFMDFVAVTDISHDVFNIGLAEVGLSYSLGLWAALVISAIASYGLQQKSWVTFALIPIFNVLGAWLRWLSVRRQNFGLCIASTLCVGVAFGVCAAAFAVVGERWFTTERRVLATQIAVQANYGGWCAAALILPACVQRPEDMDGFLFKQAVGISLGLPMFLFFHNEGAAKPLPPAADQMSLAQSLHLLLSNLKYVIQLFSFVVIGSIGYAVPAIQDDLLGSRAGLTPAFTKWTNFAFIFSGIMCGMLVVSRTLAKPLGVIKIMFAMTALSLVVLEGVVELIASHRITSSVSCPLLILAMAGAGGGSIGFIGVGLTVIANAVPQVNEAYSAGLVEILVQAGGAALSQLALNAYGFWFCGGISTLAALVLIASVRSLEDLDSVRSLE